MNRLLIPFLLCSISLLFGNDHIKYKRYENKNPKRLAHHFKINPRRMRIELVNGSDSCMGLETVSSIAARTGALLAFNGGYFQGGRLLGVPDGPNKIKGVVVGSCQVEHGALGWRPCSLDAHIDRLKIKTQIMGGGNRTVDVINRQMHDDRTVLYTPDFNHTTLTPSGTQEIAIIGNKFCKLPNRSGSNVIPQNAFVYAAGKKSRRPISLFNHNRHALIKHTYQSVLNPDKSKLWNGFEYIVSGNVILSNGTLIRDYHKEDVPDGRSKQLHARTAVGLGFDGWWHVVIVEGNHKGRVGITYDQLGELMKKVGCRFALALDGGGSSTFSYKGETRHFFTHKNHPVLKDNFFYHPDGGERPVGNAIIVKPKR